MTWFVLPDLLLLHAAVTWALVGLIWTVQLAIYPLFPGFDRDQFPAWHQRYTSRIGLVVAPLMLVELATALLWCHAARDQPLPWIGLALIAALWLLTAFVQVPQHRRLATDFDAPTARRLVRGNWARTALWTARGTLVAVPLLTP